MTFCNRVPVQWVLEKPKFASWRPWRALFFVLRAERGDHNLYWFRKSQAILLLIHVAGPNQFSGKVLFSGPPLRKYKLFLLDDSSAGMGTTFFHQNHKNSFGVTNSNMKTLARSKKLSYFYKSLILYYKNKGFVASEVSATVSFSRCAIYRHHHHHRHFLGHPPNSVVQIKPHTSQKTIATETNCKWNTTRTTQTHQ